MAGTEAPPLLEIAIRHGIGGTAGAPGSADATAAAGLTLSADLRLGPGLTALFGPSGAGKTTLLHAVAGLIRPHHGLIRFEGAVWSRSAGPVAPHHAADDTGARDGPAETSLFVAPHRRRIGTVFQEPRLFPHLSVRGNLLYGQHFTPKAERRETLERIVSLLRLGPLLARATADLSGGEQQRVALGRALMTSPRLLLMDEPLSALDRGLKAEILADIERIRDETGVPILYVSHALDEVTRLATRVVTIEAGQARLLPDPGDLLLAPANTAGPASGRAPSPSDPFGAGPMPGSFLVARISAHLPEDGLTLAESRAGPLFLTATDLAPATVIRLFLPARDLVLATGEPGALSTLNRLPGRVLAIVGAGPSRLVQVDCQGQVIAAEITRRSLESLGLEEGRPVWLLFKALSIDPQGLYRQG